MAVPARPRARPRPAACGPPVRRPWAPGREAPLERDAAGREQERERGTRVIRLAAQDELQRDHRHAGDRHRAEAAGRGAAQRPALRPPIPGSAPRRCRGPARASRRAGCARPRSAARGTRPGRASRARPARRGPAPPGPRRSGRRSAGSGCAAGGARRCRKPAASAASRKAMFHLASLATPAQPPIATHQRGSRLARSFMTSSSVAAQNTKSGVVVVSSCMAPRYSPQVAAASAASSWPVRPAPSRPAHHRRHHHQRAEGQRGQDPEAGEGVPGQRRAEPGQQRGQRRLVHVAERQVLPGRQEVQLVAHVAVARADRHLDGHRGHGDQRDPGPGRRGPGGRRGIRSGRHGPNGVGSRGHVHAVMRRRAGAPAHRAPGRIPGSPRRGRARPGRRPRSA